MTAPSAKGLFQATKPKKKADPMDGVYMFGGCGRCTGNMYRPVQNGQMPLQDLYKTVNSAVAG